MNPRPTNASVPICKNLAVLFTFGKKYGIIHLSDKLELKKERDDMRKCLRCETAMVEDLTVMVTGGGYGIDVREKGMFKGALGKLKCAVCPECGYTETYMDDPERVKKLNQKSN